MQLVIKPTDGTPPFLVDVPGASAADAQAAAAAHLGVSPSDVALSFGGRVLAGAVPLSAAGVGNLDTLHASISAFRARGAAAARAPSPAASQPPPQPSAPPPGGGDAPLQAQRADEGEEECTICLESYAPAAPPVTLQCRHSFHAPCIAEWSRSSPLCPLCRRPIQALQQPPPPPAYAASSGNPFGPPPAQPTVAATLPPAAAAAGAAAAASSSPTKPPSAVDVQKMLAATRERLRGSAEWQAVKRSVDAFAASDIGRLTVASARAAYALTTTLASAAADEAIKRSSVAANVAARLGYGEKVAAVQQKQLTQQTQAQLPYAPMPPPQQQQQAFGGGGGAWGPGRPPSGGAAAPPPRVSWATAQTQLLPVVLRCPRCQQLLQAPSGAPVFSCICGQLLQR